MGESWGAATACKVTKNTPPISRAHWQSAKICFMVCIVAQSDCSVNTLIGRGESGHVCCSLIPKVLAKAFKSVPSAGTANYTQHSFNEQDSLPPSWKYWQIQIHAHVTDTPRQCAALMNCPHHTLLRNPDWNKINLSTSWKWTSYFHKLFCLLFLISLWRLEKVVFSSSYLVDTLKMGWGSLGDYFRFSFSLSDLHQGKSRTLQWYAPARRLIGTFFF